MLSVIDLVDGHRSTSTLSPARRVRYRYEDVDHAVVPLRVDDGWSVSIVLNRRGSAFTERECALLDAVRGQLAALHALSRLRDRARHAPAFDPALAQAAGWGIARFDRALRVVSINARGAALLGAATAASMPATAAAAGSESACVPVGGAAPAVSERKPSRRSAALAALRGLRERPRLLRCQAAAEFGARPARVRLHYRPAGDALAEGVLLIEPLATPLPSR